MKFRLEIDMYNNAFADDYRPELCRILMTRVAPIVRDWSPRSLESDPVPLRDINGNRCGEFRITAE